jgi:lysophospholipase L1-like esterase
MAFVKAGIESRQLPPSTPPPTTPPPGTPPPGTPPPGTPAPTTPPSSGTVRVMPLGDSITGSPGCWRALLWQSLQNAGRTNVDFVGTLPAQGCGFPYDGENEGHGGALVTAVADQNQVVAWLAATHPDVVLMHFGTNDVWSNRSTATILAAYTRLVEQMRAGNPRMKVLVAQILPMAPSSCPECAQRVVDLNAAIPAWAAGASTTASPVTVVDQWTGFDTATDTGDGVHPNDRGNRKIADRWYPALTAALG